MLHRLAFVHIGKTAGSTVNGYLVQRVFRGHGYKIYNAGRFKTRGDWGRDELLELLERNDPRAYVHNHAANWPEDIVRTYRQAGYFVFSWVRHPGDQLCSFYHWSQERDPAFTAGLDLNGFVAKVAGDPTHMRWRLANLMPPSYWRDLDFIAEYSDSRFATFLQTTFGHDYAPTPRRNVSANRGYQVYRAEEAITDRTHEMLVESRWWTA